MTNFAASIDRDGNRQVIDAPLPFLVTKSMTLAGGTTNDPGDYNGTGNPATLFTVTGDVLVIIFATCQTNLAGLNATIEIGISGNTASLIAQTTATDIDDGKSWIDATPLTVEGIDVGSPKILVDGTDIIQTVATANITTGALVYYCFWRPLSSDGNIVAA